MKNFFRSLLPTLAALIIFVIGSIILLFVAISFFSYRYNKLVVSPNSILTLNLASNFPESNDAGLIYSAYPKVGIVKTETLPLCSVIQALNRAAYDKSISALYITGNFQPAHRPGPAVLKELREAILKFKTDSGKPVIAYNHSWTQWDYYVCSGASKLYMNPFGDLEIRGILREQTFFAGAFKKYGIGVQVARVGKYKSAIEPYTLDKMSVASREQATALLKDVWDDWKGVVATNRKLTKENIQHFSDVYGCLSARNAIKFGLVDESANVDQVLDELKGLTGQDSTHLEFPKVSMDTYIRIPTEVRNSSKNYVALFVVEGEIVDGNGYGNQVGGDKLSNELRKLRLNPQIKAIVMRVNSPGGTFMASELIQRELVLTRKEKPVVVSMGDVAASGGYLISTYADRIFAEPNTITGSIGVYGLQLNFKQIANKHGITWDSVQTSKLSGIITDSRPKNNTELAIFQNLVNNVYNQFIDQVAVSRRMSKDQVNNIAQGRVWSGQKALEIGLVDELGGIQSAVNYAAQLAKLGNNYKLKTFPEPSTLRTQINRLLVDDDDDSILNGSDIGLVHGSYSRLSDILTTLQTAKNHNGIYARMPFNISYR